MILNNSTKKKIQTAVTLALISSGIIPAVKAEVADQSVDNPAGTTIDQGSGTKAVDLDNGSTFTITNAGTISASGSNMSYGINVDSSTTVSTLTNSGTILGETNTNIRRMGRGIVISSHASIGTLTNSGTITGQGRWYDGRGFYMTSTNGTLSSFINTSSGIIQGISGVELGIIIYSLDGKKVLTTNKKIINTTGLKSGYYILEVKSESFISRKKLIIK